MQNSEISDRTSRQNALWTRSFVLCLAALCIPLAARADVSFVGDVTPGLLDDGTGLATMPLVIGDTDVGGLFMDIAPPLAGPLQTLSTDTGVIGNGVNSIGAAVFDDFGVRWEIDTSLSVGVEGQGFLDVFESALIQVGGTLPGTGTTVIGEMATGQGVITLNGLATRLTTSDLTVGDLGIGTIEANSGASFVSEISILGNQDGSTGTVTLSGLGTRWDLRDSLTIGNGNAGATSAHGFLNINGQALLQSNAAASVIINETGQVNLSGGTLRQLIGGPAVSNGGVIRGDGFINADLDITATGELRNAAATANQREYLLVSGAVAVAGNSDGLFDAGVDGLIESLGGEMEFEGLVTNMGVIVARDAIMRFRGPEVSGTAFGLVNTGLLVLGEATTVYGTIDNTGGIIVDLSTGLAPANIFGDVVFTSSPLIAAISDGEIAAVSSDAASLKLIVNDDPSMFTILGDLILGTDSVFELDYSSGVSSQTGDSFSVLSATNIVGDFTNTLAIANGRFWDVDVIGDEVVVTATNQFVSSFGDFNGDGGVDGFDFLAWQRGFGSAYGADDLANWEATYNGSGPVAAASAVPEPSTLFLALSALAFCTRRRVL